MQGIKAMATKLPLNVQNFPRPPRLEKVPRHIRIVYRDTVIADTKEAYWVLETHHPPTYYLPPSSVQVSLKPLGRPTRCEWKGVATYHRATIGDISIDNRIWSYEDPTPEFKPIQGYLCFYVGPWDCFVDGEKVQAQPGDFYGGWQTSEIEGVIKGRNGNFDPRV